MRWLLLPLLLLTPLQAAPASAQEATSVLVVYSSRTGQTEALAKAVHAGVDSVDGVTALLRESAAVTDDDIVNAAGIAIGTPVHFGNMSVEAKQLVDRLGGLAGTADAASPEAARVAGVFVTSGSPANGNELTRLSIISALLAMRYVIVGGVTAQGRGSVGSLAITGGSDPGVSESELEDARLLGVRLATAATALRRP